MKHITINNLNIITNKVKTLSSKVNIIAVSKTHPFQDILPLIESGHIHFGENKVQEALNKWPIGINKIKNVKLHMLGKLQTNKVKQAVDIFDYIHSLDSEKLAKKIFSEQKKISKKVKLFIQINIGNEPNKSGIKINELENFYNYTSKELNLEIVGLMCIPPISNNPKTFFQLMNELSNEINVKELSMGMSADYLEAINCGATFVRIGTNIFGKRN
jgi:PLP dependent protein